MKLTVSKILQISNALQVFPECDPRGGMALRKWRSQLKADLQSFTEEERALITKLDGAVLPDGSIKWKEPEKQFEFAKLRQEMFDHEIEVSCEPVKLALIIGPDGSRCAKLSPELLHLLEDVITD